MCGKVAIATTEAAEKGYDFALLCFFFFLKQVTLKIPGLLLRSYICSIIIIIQVLLNHRYKMK